MADDFKHDLFLSHSAKDKAVVRPLAERLRTCRAGAAGRRRKDGLRVWLVPPKPPGGGGFDEWVIKPGDSIAAKIEEGLERSRVLACPAEVAVRRRMLCMSANAFWSDWAQLEAGMFRLSDPLNKERRFIPEVHHSAFIIHPLSAAPIKASLAQFLHINRPSADREHEFANWEDTQTAASGVHR